MIGIFPSSKNCVAFGTKLAIAGLVLIILLDAVSNYKYWNRITLTSSTGSVYNELSIRGALQTKVYNNQRLLLGEESRPIMYTYYTPAATDMTNEANMELLEAWKKAWHDAGWEPVILNEVHARGLPEFDALMDLIVDPTTIGTYNMACYIRWIAMAAVDGGFMSDYDTFPLNHFLRHGRELPFAGQLTIWERHVPCLVSGNGSEYFRMAKKIGRSLQEHVYKQKYINENGSKDAYRQQVRWSDMLALLELYKKSSAMFIRKREVLDGLKILQNPNWSKDDCEMARGMRAVHFSHQSIKEGKQTYRGSIHRATIARQFLNRFHEVCEYTPVAD